MSKTRKRHSLLCRVEKLLIFLGILALAWLLIFAYLGFFKRDIKFVGTESNSSINLFGNNNKQEDAPKEATVPIGVMIENSVAARPFQKGLSSAKIVYEAPTEAGISRFLAVFPSDSEMPKIGPIRSVRPYYIDWIAEYGGALAHVGGSDEALRKLAQMNRDEMVIDLDQFKFGNSFWRENIGRTALEHTMFSDGNALRSLVTVQAEPKKVTTTTPKSSRFRLRNKTAPGESAHEVNIQFGFPAYAVRYSYDAATNRYLRFQAGAPHIDQNNGEQIAPKVIIVQRVRAWPLADGKSRIGMQTVGSGNATVFMDGHAIAARWEKSAQTERTNFFDDAGNKIEISTYPAWIEVVPDYNSVEYFARLSS